MEGHLSGSRPGGNSETSALPQLKRDEKGKPRRAGTFVRVMPKPLNVPPQAFYSGADRMADEEENYLIACPT